MNTSRNTPAHVAEELDRLGVSDEGIEMNHSTTPVPAGTCLVHGSYLGSACPTCSTGGGIPTNQHVFAQPVVEPAKIELYRADEKYLEDDERELLEAWNELQSRLARERVRLHERVQEYQERERELARQLEQVEAENKALRSDEALIAFANQYGRTLGKQEDGLEAARRAYEQRVRIALHPKERDDG